MALGRTGWGERDRARRVIARDRGVCHICGRPGADVADHVVALAEGGPDDEANMAAAHAEPCHRLKTTAEAARARRNRPGARRPTEAHPGLVTSPVRGGGGPLPRSSRAFEA